MGNVVRAAFGGNRFDVNEARAAANAFKRYVRVAAREFADHTRADGEVRMTVEQLQEATGFGRGILLAAVRELLKSGVLERDRQSSWVYQWNPERVAELAEQTNTGCNSTSVEKSDSHHIFFQAVWVDAYERARGVAGASIQLPAKKDWPIVERFGDTQTALHKVALETIAELSCGLFFKRKLVNRQTGELVKHPMSWLPHELDHDMARSIAKALARRATTPPPSSSSRPTERPSDRAQHAAAALAAMQRAS